MHALHHSPRLLAGALLALSGLAAQAATFATWASAFPHGNGGATNVGGAYWRTAELNLADRYGDTAFAKASLADGSLRSTSTSVLQTDTCYRLGIGCNGSQQAEAYAGFTDYIVFDGSKLKEPGVIKWRFDFTGVEDDGPQGRNQRGGAYAQFGLALGPTYGSMNWSTVHDGDTLRGEILMPNGPNSEMGLWITASLATRAWWGGMADYSHTARFNWELPAGISYHSASATFMSNRPTTPVPEPSQPALLGAGLLAMLAVARRRRPRG